MRTYSIVIVTAEGAETRRYVRYDNDLQVIRDWLRVPGAQSVRILCGDRPLASNYEQYALAA
ncbi:hypothetical protein [Allosphingosinicella deserti]|uniref:Uncharacterized protein n=1 Tax=Allosphingosinicella deserti TaxID=2116704 RepID=A0A2P7QLU9_9SPHN|nr:hypothetical protein [Sphingomonas deserti]PSJ38953.1 hypothetical protein C7I55_16705 [Sphingomonas deserti]